LRQNGLRCDALLNQRRGTENTARHRELRERYDLWLAVSSLVLLREMTI